MLADSHCLVCGADSSLWATRQERTVRRCRGCGLLWVPEGLAMVAGVSIYEDDSPVFFKDGRDAYYLDPTNIPNAEERYRWVSAFSPGGELLDVGSAFGHFAAVAQRHRPVTAIELSPVAVKWARDTFSIQISQGSIYGDYPEFMGRFAAVTLWDVIEHVPDPERALRIVKTWLRPGGKLFISTPDAGSLVARMLGRRWHHVDPVQHLVLFDRRNLSALLTRSGFRVSNTRSFGRIYNTTYIANKISSLGRNTAAWRVAGTALHSALWALPSHLRVNAGDVMGIAAELEPGPAADDRPTTK
jgi:2-polyprenyl-3-methyl-5-hydroxy-6-metoxy-1,4-benzoquinol methylase